MLASSVESLFCGRLTLVRLDGLRVLTIAAAGRKADPVKPLQGFDDNVLEILLRHRGDAYRVIYAAQIAGRA